MTDPIASHWGAADIHERILDAMRASGLSAGTATIEQLAPVDHIHARGFAATKELADSLPIRSGDRIVDIGCGIGGPARYLADRFGCHVEGIDISEPFVDAGNRLSEMTRMRDRVTIRYGDGQKLPYADESFDGGYAQHVTMNVPDRDRFFAEAFRVLRPGAFFALTEHGLGAAGTPHHPLPWSEDGAGAYLLPPEQTVALLGAVGFQMIEVVETGIDYLQGYRKMISLMDNGALPPLGVHIILGPAASEKIRNAARNIEEFRTRPVRIMCRKPQ
ncbi:methyltransferase family protein [Stella humosa]|uniref:Methyltransferase family protein n=1 Tax=Stella humosa TaxID=94 RepID=A0A3N1MJ04_9PROT|nr:class I SAM-dependent methyltransferase [Stella humosa]ROQ03319.1 methyltransferase family protein [Stella humosa]BBK33309.1 SAM-dependent methyltransferase [Stella humosa]